MSQPYLYQFNPSENVIQAQYLASGTPEGDDSFYKSVRWSPDGTLLAAHTEDNSLHIYDVNDTVLSQGTTTHPDSLPRHLSPTTAIPHANRLIDYSWYPLQHRTWPATNCIVESTRDHPLHLRDTTSGQVRAHYTAYDSSDVLMTANSVLFASDGNNILAGYTRTLAMFDTQRPGLPVTVASTSPTRRSRDGVRGIISCLATAPTESRVLAYASFNGQIGLCSAADCSPITNWHVPREYAGQGITHLRWSPDGVLLWAGMRCSDHIVAWDIRDLRGPYAVVERPARTQQRMAFDFDSMGAVMAAGQVDGSVRFYETAKMDEPETAKGVRLGEAHGGDVVAGVACHPHYAFLATAAGQRRFEEYGDDDGLGMEPKERSPSLKVWSIDARYFEPEQQIP